MSNDLDNYRAEAPRLFLNNPQKTRQDLYRVYEMAIRQMKDWEADQKVLRLQGTHFVPEIKAYAYPYNVAGIIYYERPLGRFYGPKNCWEEHTAQAVRMGAQLVVEESEAPDAPWVRLWIGHVDEPVGDTPPATVALKEWLDAQQADEPDRCHFYIAIPKNLLDAIDRKDPALERKPYAEWFCHREKITPYSKLPLALQLAHEVLQFVPDLQRYFDAMLQAAHETQENALRQKSPLATHPLKSSTPAGTDQKPLSGQHGTS